MTKFLEAGSVVLVASLLLVGCEASLKEPASRGASALGAVQCLSEPSDPTGFTAEAFSSDSIFLTWNSAAAPPECQVSYTLYRSTDIDQIGDVISLQSTDEYFNDTGLKPSTTYYYMLEAETAQGPNSNWPSAQTTTFSDSIRCSGPPSSPFGLAAKADSSTQINLSWAAVIPPVGCSVTYEVYRDTSSGFSPSQSSRVAAGLTRNGFTDSGLAPSTTYYYIIRAVDEVSGSDDSAQVSATTLASGPSCTAGPSAPTELKAVVSSSSQVNLSWRAVVPPSGCSVTYAVFRSLNKDFSSPTELASGLTSTSFSSTGLSPSTTYYFGVRSHTSSGYAEATPVSATTFSSATCTAAPSSPTGFTATAGSPSQINLSWTAVTPPPACSVTYALFRDTNSNFTPGWGNLIAAQLSKTSYSDVGLSPSTTYYYLMQAVDSVGISGNSAKVNATTLQGPDSCSASPGSVSELSATPLSPTRIDVSWKGVAPPAGCSVTYSVFRSLNKDFSSPTQLASGLTSTSFSSTGLSPSTTYYFGVRSHTSKGYAEAAPVSATTPGSSTCTAAPLAPSGVMATAKSPRQIDLTWNAVAPPSGCPAVTYAVYQSTTNNFTPSDANRVAMNLSSAVYSGTGLTASTTYYFIVRAIDAAGSSPSSSQVSAATSADSSCSTAPSVPIGLTATASSSSQINLSWGAVSPPTGCSALTYVVYQSTDGGFIPSDTNRVATNLPSPSYSSTGLTPSTTYYFTVRAVDVAGSSPDSNKASAVTQAGSGTCSVAPSAPSIVATASSANQINLTWNAVASPPGCSAVTYVVYQSTDSNFAPSDATRVAANLSTAGYSSTGLLPSATYSFVVRALNVAGASPDSNKASATTKPDSGTCSVVPPAPTGLAATATSSGQIDLSWSASTPPSGCSVTYAVYRSTSDNFTPADTNCVANNLPSPSYSATGLAPSTLYYFKVRALDAAGQSPNSAQASATTQSGKGGGCSAVGAAGDALFSFFALAGLALRPRRQLWRSGQRRIEPSRPRRFRGMVTGWPMTPNEAKARSRPSSS